jgi:fucose 4-O-acetylase-like acetyltransferase
LKEEGNSIQVLDILKERNDRYFQVDFLKAIMIFLVIFDHTVPWELKNFMGVALWERISIPIFLVIMGFNMGLSFKKTGEISLKKLYSRRYLKKKFWRYIFPFLVLYMISTIFGLIVYEFNFELLWFGQHYDAVYGHWRWDMVHLLISMALEIGLYLYYSGQF